MAMTDHPPDPPAATGDPDQEICICFHVTRRKIENFIRLERPRRAAQLADCYGAGTGCGWCRKYLVALFEAADLPAAPPVGIPPAEQYQRQRGEFHRQIGWGPPQK